ncbi:Uma2 family endonuclease [Candidatus Binatia bacterium]|nr:Uma2 family endonuclease [Candidatus Binatia bacterium]
MSLEEWAALDEEVEGELVDGVLEEEEMPTYLHELVVAWLIDNLRRWARTRRGFVVGSEAKIAVGSRRGRKPDVSVYLRSRQPGLNDRLITVAPHLVVEVVTARARDVRRDRIDKLADYGGAGIRYYWIVDPQVRGLEILELGRSRRYSVALAASAGTRRIPGCPGLALDLDALWREIDEAGAATTRGRSKKR